MEEKKLFMLLIIALNQIAHGDSLARKGAVGCSRHENLCRYDEFCNKAEFYPYGKCNRIIFKKPLSNKQPTNNENGASKSSRGNTQYDMTYFGNNQNDWIGNGKYDMTHFSGDVDAISHEERSIKDSVKNTEQILSERNFDRSYRKDEGSDVDPVIEDILYNQERKRTSKHGQGDDANWPPIGIPLPIPKDDDSEFEYKQTRNLRPIEKQNFKSPNKFGNRLQDSGSIERNELVEKDESLDLDIEIKPLSLSDSRYFEEDKSKLSSIPEAPNKNPQDTQKIEHVRANIVSKSGSKKTKVGVLVGGKLDKTKTDIVQNNSPDSTYDKVKDFFKSQKVSSIVDAPQAERKEAVKLYNIPHEENVDIKRSSIPEPVVHPDRIRLDVKERLNPDKASDLLGALQDLLWENDESRQDAFTSVATDEKTVLFHLLNNTATNGVKPSHVVQRINRDKSVKEGLKKAVGVTVIAASLDNEEGEKTEDDKDDSDHNFMVTTLIVAGCVSGTLLVSVCIFIILRRTSNKDYPRWGPKQPGEAASDYQSLWRQLKHSSWESPVQTTSVSHSDDGTSKDARTHKGLPPSYSWSEEPVDTKMDISTGHAILAYMEDHLKNENRLSREWEDLSVYQAEPDSTDVGKDSKNGKKNRYSDVLPYDHSRVKLRDTSNATGSDYINASFIIDDDPRNPAYIATQGPLASTVADFWQMIWEQGVVIIVMLTKLADLGLPQCHRYWPQKGHEVYHIYQVHLISEHIWCSDYLVRSFYLKNVQTGETRTVTQFHYLTWPHLGIPFSSKPLLDFRRKVRKCFRSHSCPVVVHCSGGIDRTGTYILIDMVLSKMSKGTKEIDIAATLEHLRDQRPQMVKTKAQFEFALASVAEEVNAILQVLTKH